MTRDIVVFKLAPQFKADLKKIGDLALVEDIQAWILDYPFRAIRYKNGLLMGMLEVARQEGRKSGGFHFLFVRGRASTIYLCSLVCVDTDGTYSAEEIGRFESLFSNLKL